MEPAKISYNGLTEETFLLPEMLQPFLPGSKNNDPKLYIGLPNWNYKEEERKKNSPQPQPGTLPFYARHFNCIELNITHEEMPKPELINKWYKGIEDPKFRFCARLHKYITDSGTIDTHKAGITKDFIKAISELKEKLGSTLLMAPAGFDIGQKDKLISYLEILPETFELSVALSHDSWYSKPETIIDLAAQLNRLNKGMVITDTPARRNLIQMQLSNPTAYIHFHCIGSHALDEFRIQQWKKKLRSWFLQGLDKCYFFLFIEDKEAEDYFIDLVREEFSFG